MKKVDTLQKPSLRYKEKKFEYKRSYTEYIAFGTLLLLTGSFLNNVIVMLIFDINVANYYDAKDYITSSASTLALLIFSGLLGILLFYIDNKLIKKDQETKKDKKNKLKETGKILLLFIAMICLLKIAKFTTVDIVILLIIIGLSLATIYLSKQFKNKEIRMIVFLTCIFHIMIIEFSVVEIKEIKKDTNKNYFYLDKNDEKEINSMKYIKTISKYSFFYDEKQNKAIVIPNTDIIRIERLITKF